MTRALPVPALLGGAALILAASGVAVSSYRANRHPDPLRSESSSAVWLGPKGPVLQEAIDARIRRALAALNGNVSRPFADYGAELRAAKALLQRAVLANVADTRAIQRLAAVNWELGVLDDTLDGPGLVGLVAIGGARAPRVPEIQAELGGILYKLGRPDDARAYMARAVSLSPRMAYRVVPIMVDAGATPLEIIRILPPSSDVLVALTPILVSQGRGDEMLEIVENRVGIDPSGLIATYGDLALTAGQGERLSSRLAAIGTLKDARDEAERQLQLGRAAAREGAQRAAYDFGVKAVALWPADPRHSEFAAAAALDSGQAAEAERILRECLARLATIDGTSSWRARLNRALGEVYERTGRGDDALVYFRRALEHDPDEPIAKAKVAQIDALLGGKPGQTP